MTAKKGAKKSAKTKKASQKPAEEPEVSLEGKDSGPNLEGDETANLDGSEQSLDEDQTPDSKKPKTETPKDDIPDTDLEDDPEPVKDDEKDGQKPDKDPIECRCGWKGTRDKLVVDNRLARPVYCPKCGIRHFHPKHDKKHGGRNLT